VAALAMVSKLLADGIELVALSVDDHHFHLLARFPDHSPRRWVGRAKMHASMLLRDWGLKGGVWARGCRALPVADRGHQVNANKYIVMHRRSGAAVWTFRDPPPNLR
jgi:REP element-mobilizing transposase RayT